MGVKNGKLAYCTTFVNVLLVEIDSRFCLHRVGPPKPISRVIVISVLESHS